MMITSLREIYNKLEGDVGEEQHIIEGENKASTMVKAITTKGKFLLQILLSDISFASFHFFLLIFILL